MRSKNTFSYSVLKAVIPGPLFATYMALVVSLCLLLPLPAAAGAFDQLSGTYVRSEQQGGKTPTDCYEFSDGTFTYTYGVITEKGNYSISGNIITFVYSDGKIAPYQFSRTPNAIMLSDGIAPITFVQATDEQVAAIAAARKAAAEVFKAAGFIAVGDSRMTWSDAKAFCQQNGGRLPFTKGVQRYAAIDGFGSLGAPWPSCLPEGNYYYWADTDNSISSSGLLAVHSYGGMVHASPTGQSHAYHVVCVP